MTAVRKKDGPTPCADCGQRPGMFCRDSETLSGPLICGECHTEKFWREHAERFAAGDPAVAIVDGYHFRMGAEGVTGFGQGSGGNRYHFRFKDGRGLVTSTNVWHQGRIPERWRDRLPDNAEHVPPCGYSLMTAERRAECDGMLHCQEPIGHAGWCCRGLFRWMTHGPLLEKVGDELLPYTPSA